jgi:23S rRNA (cytosine1962-C5)-methyltransferase
MEHLEKNLQNKIDLLFPPEWQDYELLDSGNGKKLERYGSYLLERPEPEAIWKPALAASEWKKAHAVYQPPSGIASGHWNFHKPIEEKWSISLGNLHCLIQLSNSRHIGVFPEQAPQWNWIRDQIESAHRPIKLLNLFSYTGLATLTAALAGAAVTHVDASRRAVNWAKKNQLLSKLETKPIRWIVDDALKFVRREARRGNTYEGIILDPPKFGRGPKGEMWEFYRYLPRMLEACVTILSPDPSFLVLTAYAVKASSLTLYWALKDFLSKRNGCFSAGELAQKEKSAGRVISRAIFARWTEI